MKIATILYTYNRSVHTNKVLQGLRANTVLPQKLFVFQDGLRNKDDHNEWNKVNTLLKDIDWCDVEVNISAANKGLANSIVDGINFVLRLYDAVIVLEDDCVPMPGFISFMTQCLEKYENDEKICSVSGYNWPISLKSLKYDAYFCGRFSSWGWGTWRDRWEKYERDYEILQRLKKTREGSYRLALWGNDLEMQMVDRVKGENDSWAVFWALKVIERKGLCVNPYNSLIHNIGCDGSGVHCGESNRFEVPLDLNERQAYRLPENDSDIKENERAFAELWGGYTALANDTGIKREKALIYGLGKLFFLFEKDINEQYEIEAFVDRGKKGFYAGKEIIKPEKIGTYIYDKIYVAIRDEEESLKVAGLLNEKYGIPLSKIIIGLRELENAKDCEKNHVAL